MKYTVFFTVLLFCNCMMSYGQKSIPENKEITMKLAKITGEIPKYDQESGIYPLYNWRTRKEGLADSEGNILVPVEWDNYTTMWLEDYGFIVGERNGRKVIFDIKKRQDIPYESLFDELSVYIGDAKKYDERNCYFVVKKNGKEGVWRYGDEHLLVPCLYDEIVISHMNNVQYWPVKINGKTIGLYGNGKELIPCGKYTFIYPNAKEQCAVVSEGNNKVGLVNLSTGFSTALIYDNIGFFAEKCIGYNQGGKIENGKFIGGKWGYMDTNGNQLTKPIYDEISKVKDGVAQVKHNGVIELFVSPFSKETTTEIKSKVDENIPTTLKTSENTFVFIVANEDYSNMPTSKFSLCDGNIFKEYCINSFGIPKKNILIVENATFGIMKSTINRIKDIADVYEGDANIILYFSGLGTVNSKTSKRVLLPTDASMSSLNSTSFDIDKLSFEMGKLKTKSFIMIIDSPFNGENRTKEKLSDERGVSIKSHSSSSKKIDIVMSGEKGNAYAHEELRHGILTYSILSLVQDNKYNSIRQCFNSLQSLVKKISLDKIGEVQTIQIIYSDEK